MERYGSIESVLRAEIVELGAALDAEREKVKELKEWQRVVVGTGTDQEAVVRMAATEYTKTAVQCWKDENAKLTAQLATLQAQLAALTTAHQSWTEVLGEWLWNCTNLLGDYNIKTADDFNIELNRRVMWLTNNLEHTLTPPVTREEQQQIQDLTHTNARLKEALQGMLKLVDDGLLVRNIANDHIAGWWIRALPIVQALRQVDEALQPKEPKP